ncbi:Imm6 family immunity protein [Undibacterium sp. TC4M20W]|uniref:Imm6 family immunity protein n=1 Tax=Undibacterium sp. TC4M20W TaxID=3413052 RepID=UPI003BEFC930
MTVRARVAFTLCVSEQLMPELFDDESGYLLAKKCITMISSWLSGEAVCGHDLNDLLMNQFDEGIFAKIDYRTKKITDLAYTVVGAATSYAAWHAYRAEKAFLPEGIEAITEEFVQWLVDEAGKSQLFDTTFVEKTYDYLTECYRTDDVADLGPTIDFENLKQAVRLKMS